MFENAFFQYFEQSTQFIEMFSSKNNSIISFKVASTYHVKQNALLNLNKSVVYRLQYLHPAIDGVGVLYDTNGKKWWLVFFSYPFQATKPIALKYNIFSKTLQPQSQFHWS